MRTTKKILAKTISFMLIAASLTGCANQNQPPENLQGTSTASQTANDTQNSTVTESEPNSEPQTPSGEPTFLLCPDGVPLYTSEITEIYSGSDKNPATFDEAEQGIRSVKYEHGSLTCEEQFTIKCDGFTYGYIPMPALNRVDNPDMFEEDGSSFRYLGATDKSGELISTDFIRIKNGDKFGTLTVKNAYIIFGTNDHLFDGDPEAPGACVIGKGLEFDGEVELEGYICVTPADTLYGTGGDMKFYPNAESSVKIPIPGGSWRFEYDKYCHITYPSWTGWIGDEWFDVGNIHDTEFDVSGVSDGDQFVKAKITLENIRCSDYLDFDLKNLELL